MTMPSGSTKRQQLPKLVEPYSPEETPKQLLLQQPSEASTFSKTSKQKPTCTKCAPVINTEKPELYK